MGVGLVSLATLFPLGLLRLREAEPDDPVGAPGRVGDDDLGSRDLLSKQSFLNPLTTRSPRTGRTGLPRPWLINPPRDAPCRGFNLAASAMVGRACRWPTTRSYWEAVHQAGGITPLTAVDANGTQIVGRFGTGLGFVRPDPDGNGPAAAYGMQRITNFARS